MYNKYMNADCLDVNTNAKYILCFTEKRFFDDLKVATFDQWSTEAYIDVGTNVKTKY